MKTGIAVGGSLAEVASFAARADAAGLESVWVAELDRSAFVQAALAISATTRVGVGTAVALAFPRSPTVTAMTAWDLDELSGDRFTLGLGPQVKRVLEARFSVRVDHPAPQMREYVQAVRTVWAANRGEPGAGGQPLIHEGEHYRISMPTFHGPPRPSRRDTPILLAAVGPVMARVAGEVADGLLGHPLASPRYLREVVAPAIVSGLERAGRPASACPISATLLVSLGDDADEARRAARLQIAFYATTPSYKAILELHDRKALPRDLRRAFVNGDRARMAELIDDELLDAIAIAGRPDEAMDRLRAWEDIAERTILGVPWYGLDTGRQRETIEAALDFGARLAREAS
jgi:probable F420-dependent oxidoreductase